jgi:hypothetical protein
LSRLIRAQTNARELGNAFYFSDTNL